CRRKDKTPMPVELAPYLPHLPALLIGLAGLFIGWLITRLSASVRIAALRERLKAEERQLAAVEARFAVATAESDRQGRESQALQNQLTELRTRLDAERRSAAEKQMLLQNAEEKLSATFK